MNNREIKFRIWDKQNKKWLENSSSLHCYSNWTICPFTGNLVDYVGAFDGDHGDFFTASPAVDCYYEGTKFVKEPRYVIQQYTGLKDSKGNEIYEGDILMPDTIDGIWPEQRNGILVKDIRQPFANARLFKIIGNIFENPELIKNNE